MTKKHITVLEIDTNALQFNLQYFKSKIADAASTGTKTKIIAVVKAFGYGSDALMITKSIQDQVAYFAVAYTDEGITLRKAGIETPILILHPHEVNLATDIEYKLEPCLYKAGILTSFLSVAKEKNLQNFPIHLKFNTGLNRLGFKKEDIAFIGSKLRNNTLVKVASIFSHLAASEDKTEREFTLQQIEKFENISKKTTDQLGFRPLRHITNTSGIINYPQTHYDMVRLGIGLYGFGNSDEETSKLKNVFSLKSIISQIHTIKKGESVGYNRAFIAQNKTITATIPIGHADGISRKMGNGIGYVSIHGQKAEIIGNVCMDMIMVDISTIDCKEGDEVIVFNHQKIVEDLATRTQTISYELITAISQRVKRISTP